MEGKFFQVNSWHFAVALDKKRSDDGFSADIIDASNDTLKIGNYFPFDLKFESGADVYYSNYFIRKN